MYKSKFSPWIRFVALLVTAVFLPEQICWAGFTDEFKSRLPSLPNLKSTAQSYVSTAQSYVSQARTIYNTATRVSGAIQQVTGVSPARFDSISNKIGLIKFAAGLAAGVITKNPQTVTQAAKANWGKEISTTVNNGLANIKNDVYNKAIWARDQTILKPGFNDSPKGKEHWKALGTYFLFITGPTMAGEKLLASSVGVIGTGIARYAPSLTIDIGSWALRSGQLGRGLNYIPQGKNLLLNSRPVVTYGKWVLAPTGILLMGNTLYGYSPLKSPAFSAYTHNQGQITNLMDKISLAQHIRQPGSFNVNSYETAISDLSQAFPGETATSEKVSDFLVADKEKYKDIKFDDPEIAAHLTQIVQLSNKNGELGGKFNVYEKAFTGLAEVNTAAVYGLANGINSLGVPYAGEFVKSVGSFTPLTGLSIGGSVGADPGQGFHGFANFIVSPVEDIVGLRTGSFIYYLAKIQNPFQDYHANYRNIGRGLGSAFILYGGGREIKNAADNVKTRGIGSKFDSFLSANPRVNNFVNKPWVKPLAFKAVVMGPLAAASLWQGWNNGDLGIPFVSAAVLFGPALWRSGIGRNSQQQLKSLTGSMSVIKKTEQMDNAFSLLTKMAEKKKLEKGIGENIMTDYALTGKPFEAIGNLEGEVFKVGPHSYTALKNNVPAEYRLTPQLLTAKIGDPVYLIPNTIAPNFNSGDHKIKNKLSSFTNKISSTLKGGPNDLKNDFFKKSPIPVKSLFEDQVTTLKSMVTSGINERLTVIRGLGTGKTTALLAYVLPYKIGDNLKNNKVTLILTPNKVVAEDVKAVLRGANDVGFNHKEIQQRLETNVIFPKKITEKGLKIESVDRFEDKLQQEEDFINKVMNNDVVVIPYELYSSIYHTYLMRSGLMDAAREKVTNRIKDSNALMDEVDMPAFLPALMMSEGRKYVPEGNLEYNYWLDVAGKSRQIYDKIKYNKVNPNDMKLDKIKGETSAELDFRTMAQGQKLLSRLIPRIEELPLPDSSTVRNLVKEVKSKHLEIGYTEQEISEHIAHGAWGHRSYELRNSFTKEEYAVRTKTIPAADIDIYGPKIDINTVTVGGVEGRDIHNFDLHIPAGQHQVLEILHGAKLISRPLKGDHMGKSIDALNILGGIIGFTGTASDTVKPVLKQAGFTKFDYGQVKASDYEAPVMNSDLSRTVKDVTDSVINNRGDRLDIDITPNNLLSRLVKKVLTTQGVKPAVLAKNGENFKFVSGKYVHIGGRTPERAAQALLDSLKTKKAPYAIVGTANLIGRGLNFDPAPYLAKANTKVVVNLIEPELMTATQVLQGAGRIGGRYRFTNIKDAQGNIYNPEKSVRLLMSREMMRPMAEFKDVLSLADSKAGIKNLRIMDALQDVWNKNERDVVARSGLSAERFASNKVESEFKEMNIPVTIGGIEKNAVGIRIQDYLISKGFIAENIAQNSQARETEKKLTINGLRFMQLFKEAESLSAEQFKMLDRIKAVQLLHIDNPVELAIGLTENRFVELENYNTKGLSSVLSLARVLKPFNTDISSAEFNDYQNIISGTVEQKLEFFKGLIDKNKIKIDDSGTRDLILNKLGRQKQSWDKIQEISRQVSSSASSRNGANAATDILRLKSAYREFENSITYQDLENIRAKLNSPAVIDFIPWFIPNAGHDELTKLSAVFDFAKANKINLASSNLFELLDLTDDNKKADFARFVDKHTKNPELKIYAQRVAIYQSALEKQMRYFTQLYSGKKIDIKDYEQGLHEDIVLLNNFNIDPTKDFQLDLTQLRGLSDGKLSDELLLKVYQGPMVTKKEIENNVLDEGIRSTVEEHFISRGTPQVLSEFRQLKKLWGTEEAIKKLSVTYPAGIVNKALTEYPAISENNFGVQQELSTGMLGVKNKFKIKGLVIKAAIEKMGNVNNLISDDLQRIEGRDLGLINKRIDTNLGTIAKNVIARHSGFEPKAKGKNDEVKKILQSAVGLPQNDGSGLLQRLHPGEMNIPLQSMPAMGAISNLTGKLNEMDILGASPESLKQWITASGITQPEVDRFFGNNEFG
ncbi:MAG: hypothetical protein V1670_01260, partial [Candidatus Omnitrophota bacterium]